MSRWERGLEQPRPYRVARLYDILGRSSDSIHLQRSIAAVRADVLPSALLSSELLLKEGSRQTAEHYRKRGIQMERLIGLSFEQFVDMSGMPDLAKYLAEAELREGGALLFRFTINHRGRGHTTVIEPLFEDGTFIGTFHYISRYFDFPQNDEVSLEHVDFLPVSGEGTSVEFMRGRYAALLK